jgi:hypothetical protein
VPGGDICDYNICSPISIIILAFERKYGVRSETFYAAYVSGEEPDDDIAFLFES